MPRPGTTTARGYGSDHQNERERWRPHVEAGHATCHARHCLHTTRTITPGTPWDLGHTRDRTAWTGPEHADCNRSEGARRSGQHHTPPPPPPPTEALEANDW